MPLSHKRAGYCPGKYTHRLSTNERTTKRKAKALLSKIWKRKPGRGSEYSPQARDKTVHKAIHMVSAWASRLGVRFGQVRTEEKSYHVFSLKGNQEKIHDDMREFFTGHELDEKYCELYKIQKYEGALEVAHGRIERREGFLCTNLKWLGGKGEWPNLSAVGMVRCHRTEKKTGKNPRKRGSSSHRFLKSA